jgi:ATP-dependent 26S proteasome regulatory subunit
MFAIRENRDSVLKSDFEQAIEKVLKHKDEGGLPEIAGVMYT